MVTILEGLTTFTVQFVIGINIVNHIDEGETNLLPVGPNGVFDDAITNANTGLKFSSVRFSNVEISCLRGRSSSLIELI